MFTDKNEVATSVNSGSQTVVERETRVERGRQVVGSRDFVMNEYITWRAFVLTMRMQHLFSHWLLYLH